MTPPRAFAIAAHPDDIEFMMAGTLALLGRAGYALHYMTIADGCCGSMELGRAETARLRASECRAAAAIIQAHYHAPIAHDLEITYDVSLVRRLTAVVRAVAPEIILTQSTSEYMEDHTCTTRLVLTAAFARGIPNFRSVPQRPAVPQPVTVYHALPYGLRDPLRRPVVPDFYVDITDVLATKSAMLAAHQSQQAWLDKTQGIGAYVQTMEDMAGAVGAMSGVYAAAEGWTRHLHLGYCAADADPLALALAGRVHQAVRNGG